MYAILRTEKLKTPGNLGGLNNHLTRTIDVPHSDPELTKYNAILVGTSDLNSDVSNRINQMGITPRKNAVLAVEHLITTSPEFFSSLHKAENNKGEIVLKTDEKTQANLQEFKNKSIEWLNARYQKENVVNVTLHMDEKTPHIHAVIVPIDGKGKLNARDYFNGREKMRQMQDSFAKSMGSLGLERGIKGSKAKHVPVKQYYSRLNQQMDERSATYTLSEPPILGIGKDKWKIEESQKINQAIHETAMKSSLKDLDRFYDKRKHDRDLKDSDQLRMEKAGLRKEIYVLEDRISFLENTVRQLRAVGERIQNELMNFGFRIDMERIKIVKMTDQEREQHKQNQAIKKAELMAEQKRQQEQERNRDRGRGLSL